MKAMTLSNMIETFINETGCEFEMNKVWDTFYQMAVMGYIPEATWERFCKWGQALYIDCNGYVVDRDTDETIWTYPEGERYEA